MNDAPVFAIEKLYVKDFSVEVPNAPQIFLDRESPEIEVQLRSQARGVDEGMFEVLLTVTVTAKVKDKVAFLVEVGQAGIFQVKNVPDESVEPLLGIACPNILFPYAREAVSEATVRAGFQSVVLQPVNFESLFMSQKEAQQGGDKQDGDKQDAPQIVLP
ncbi:MAG TPA: protein-export chaperone SecB [Rhodocyclaceae bacterium]